MKGRRGAGARARAPRPPRPLQRRARPRAGSSARGLALLALLAQLCSLTHALFVRHARCEHGELVHVGALVHTVHAVGAARASGAAHAAPRAEAAAPQQAEGRAPAPGDQVAEEGAQRHRDDDHCDAFALRGQLGAPVHRVAEATLLEVLCLDALRSSPEVRPIPLLILAPKSSPPAA
ncbi:hypothetical protein [Sorangium cellulosum]|uniref:Uncharacterized protein n=1 Tax=Sorangium cellulosum So0157-2 TaxID=1254432 RepID=S4Y7L1_SORCE|nr:hypothetical protein [Sorangium cellulosum]AGP40386.1 hypothetical protein SCE1572_41325 [Sorangium cellulosum So0157-2]